MRGRPAAESRHQQRQWRQSGGGRGSHARPAQRTLVQQVGDVLCQQVNVLRSQPYVPLLVAVCAGAAAPAARNPAGAARTRHGRPLPLKTPNSRCARVCQHAGRARAGQAMAALLRVAVLEQRRHPEEAQDYWRRMQGVGAPQRIVLEQNRLKKAAPF